jgi:uncharacterized membrane protein YkvA (DUF1232 family)
MEACSLPRTEETGTVALSAQLILLVAVFALAWAILVLWLIATGRGTTASEITAFLPNLVLLFRGLATDERVPRRAKAALLLGALYLAMPIDLVPDFIPIAGQVDDAIVAAAVLRFVLGSTERSVLYEHWRGDPRTLDRVLALARA